MKSMPVLFAILILTICLDYCACRQDASNHVGSQITSGRQHSENILPAVKAAPPVFECDYLGQTLPGEIPVKFAAGIVSTRLDDSCLEIAISGKEIVFTRDGQIIWMVQVASGIWSEPAVLSFSGGETSFSKDGAKIYFNSRAPFSGMKVPLNVWTAQKSHDSWGSPAPLAVPVINQTIHAPSVAANGNLYASGIIRLKFLNGQYQSPEKLSPEIKGYHPFIASDESFLIFDHRPATGGNGADLYITFQKADRTWTGPVDLGEKINTTALETNAFVTPDQKYLFFTRQFDIYWVKADFIELLRKQVLE